MISTQYIKLNMVPNGIPPVLYCSQYDIGRPLGLVVYNGSEVVDLSTYTATIEATRTDRTPITAAVTTDGNIGVFNTTATMTNKLDRYGAKLVLSDSNGNRVASLVFFMVITLRTMDENAEGIQEDQSLYQQYTATVQTIIAQIRSDLVAEANARQAAVNAEASARQAADQTLQQNINAEASARQSADNTLQSNINAEASTRATQDASLQSQIDQLVAPSGEAPSAAEVENARIGSDGTVYPTLGDAIRTQNSLLKSHLNTLDTKLDLYKITGIKSAIIPVNGNGYVAANAGSSTGYKVINTDASAWVQKLYTVSAGKTYSIAAYLTLQSSGFVQIAFQEDWTVGEEADPIVIDGTGEYSTSYTPAADGVISVLYSVNGYERASNIVIGEADYVFEDFGAELDAVNERSKIENAIEYTKTMGYAISSDTGSPVANESCAYTTVDLTAGDYLSITFSATAFGSNFGYGFVLSDNSWSGVKTNSTETMTVDVPTGAKTFKVCWNAAIVTNQVITCKQYGSLEGVIEQVMNVFDNKLDAVVKDHLKVPVDIAFTPTSGYAISSDTGAPVENGSCAYTTIDLTNVAYYTITFKATAFGSNFGYGFILGDNSWDGARTVSTEDLTVNVPDGAKTCKISWNAAIVSVANQKITGTTLGYLEDLNDEIEAIDAKLATNPYPLDISADMSNIPNISVITPTLDVQTDIYDRYDEFATSFPYWCEKIDTAAAATALGITAPDYLSGLPIYLYKFSPTRTNEPISASRLKVMIATGTHANEQMGIFTVYYFLKYINDNWKTDLTAAQLRTMIDFYVIPCVSPWGYEHESRVNGNGVNLNRNFPTANWALSGAGTADYSGPTAGSEYETKIVMYYVNQIKPDVYFDAHTGGMTTGGRYGCIEIDQTVGKTVLNFATAYAMNLVADWIANNSDFPQYIDNSPLFHVYKDAVAGEEYRWVAEQGIDFSFLTEQSFINNWVAGDLKTTTQEMDTPRIWKENLKSVFGSLLWAIKCASESKHYTE